ncbi:hypothetical protein U1Q18_046945 [Sarracenia purpurea var. burkii]
MADDRNDDQSQSYGDRRHHEQRNCPWPLLLVTSHEPRSTHKWASPSTHSASKNIELPKNLPDHGETLSFLNDFARLWNHQFDSVRFGAEAIRTERVDPKEEHGEELEGRFMEVSCSDYSPTREALRFSI